MKSQKPIWLPEKQFREMLGICRTTSYNWRTENLVKWTKVGGKVYVLEQSVLELFESNSSRLNGPVEQHHRRDDDSVAGLEVCHSQNHKLKET